MTRTIGRMERAGAIHFGDASLHVWEEGISAARAAGGYQAAQAWERQFKRDVFARIVQTLNRLGWTVGESTYIFTGNNNRYCTKGDLQADLKLSGRSIQFEMFQNKNAPTRPDHGGRYESNKEACMPYVLRLEMERTRRRIRNYLLNVFTGYAFKADRSDGRSSKCGPDGLTALEWVQGCYDTSWHIKGDLTKYKISDYNRGSADKAMLEHGQRVWFADYHGRICTGIAMYNINNMWWVATGKYGVTNKASFELYTKCPENPRIKRNAGLRRKRLESELAKAIKGMKFERAAVLRDILFPGDPNLFVVWHNEHQLYHRAGFCGYTSDRSAAGKFTADEVRGWNKAPNKVIALDAEREAA